LTKGKEIEEDVLGKFTSKITGKRPEPEPFDFYEDTDGTFMVYCKLRSVEKPVIIKKVLGTRTKSEHYNMYRLTGIILPQKGNKIDHYVMDLGLVASNRETGIKGKESVDPSSGFYREVVEAYEASSFRRRSVATKAAYSDPPQKVTMLDGSPTGGASPPVSTSATASTPPTPPETVVKKAGGGVFAVLPRKPIMGDGSPTGGASPPVSTSATSSTPPTPPETVVKKAGGGFVPSKPTTSGSPLPTTEYSRFMEEANQLHPDLQIPETVYSTFEPKLTAQFHEKFQIFKADPSKKHIVLSSLCMVIYGAKYSKIEAELITEIAELCYDDPTMFRDLVTFCDTDKIESVMEAGSTDPEYNKCILHLEILKKYEETEGEAEQAKQAREAEIQKKEAEIKRMGEEQRIEAEKERLKAEEERLEMEKQKVIDENTIDWAVSDMLIGNHLNNFLCAMEGSRKRLTDRKPEDMVKFNATVNRLMEEGQPITFKDESLLPKKENITITIGDFIGALEILTKMKDEPESFNPKTHAGKPVSFDELYDNVSLACKLLVMSSNNYSIEKVTVGQFNQALKQFNDSYSEIAINIPG
jgi:hypothetical protein